MTPPERTVYDCLRRTDFPLGLGVADSALRQGVVAEEGLSAFVGSVPRDPRGREQAVGTLAWADPRSENGGESIARGRMLALGYAHAPSCRSRFRAQQTGARRTGLTLPGCAPTAS